MPLPTKDQVIAALRSYGSVPMKEHADDFVQGLATATYNLPEGHENMWVDSYGDTVTTLYDTGHYDIRFDGDEEPFNRGDWADLLNELEETED